MGKRDRKIKDEVAALTLREAWDEAWRWLNIIKESPPKGWELTLPKQEQLLRELEPMVREALGQEKSSTKTRDYYRAKERLSGHCERLRAVHEGKTPAQIVRKPVR
jgi:hypothetical protein